MIRELQLKLAKAEPKNSDLEGEKIGEYFERALSDLEFARKDHGQLLRTMHKLKYKNKDKLDARQKKELLQNFNDSLRSNK